MAALRLVAMAICGLVMSCGCNDEVAREAALITGGDPDRGRQRIQEHGCGACHSIPGVRNANGLVAPPLSGIARRMYLAGTLPNTPENMVRWIRYPQAIDPGVGMPDMGIDEEEGRDIAAYLYTLY